MQTFPDVNKPKERLFVHACWRYLLGWGPLPKVDPSIPAKRRKALRQMAVDAIQGRPSKLKAKILPFPKPSTTNL